MYHMIKRTDEFKRDDKPSENKRGFYSPLLLVYYLEVWYEHYDYFIVRKISDKDVPMQLREAYITVANDIYT